METGMTYKFLAAFLIGLFLAIGLRLLVPG
jgi:hypothetical protein